MTITLYEGPSSPNARKIRLLSAELGVPLARVSLDFRRGEQHAPAYLAKNPNGVVPTIDHDGFVLWESNAILKYLASLRPERGLAPASARATAQVDQWLFWWTAQPESALTRLVAERRVKPFLGLPGEDPGIVADAVGALERFLPVLDAQLQGGAYILGALSLADFAAGSWLDTVPPVVGFDLSPYASIGAWLGRLRARPYWRDA